MWGNRRGREERQECRDHGEEKGGAVRLPTRRESEQWAVVGSLVRAWTWCPNCLSKGDVGADEAFDFPPSLSLYVCHNLHTVPLCYIRFSY